MIARSVIGSRQMTQGSTYFFETDESDLAAPALPPDMRDSVDCGDTVW